MEARESAANEILVAMIDTNIQEVAEEEVAAAAQATQLASRQLAVGTILKDVTEAVLANEVRLAAIAALADA